MRRYSGGLVSRRSPGAVRACGGARRGGLAGRRGRAGRRDDHADPRRTPARRADCGTVAVAPRSFPAWADRSGSTLRQQDPVVPPNGNPMARGDAASGLRRLPARRGDVPLLSTGDATRARPARSGREFPTSTTARRPAFGRAASGRIDITSCRSRSTSPLDPRRRQLPACLGVRLPLPIRGVPVEARQRPSTTLSSPRATTPRVDHVWGPALQCITR